MLSRPAAGESTILSQAPPCWKLCQRDFATQVRLLCMQRESDCLVCKVSQSAGAFKTTLNSSLEHGGTTSFADRGPIRLSFGQHKLCYTCRRREFLQVTHCFLGRRNSLTSLDDGASTGRKWKEAQARARHGTQPLPEDNVISRQPPSSVPGCTISVLAYERVNLDPVVDLLVFS